MITQNMIITAEKANIMAAEKNDLTEANEADVESDPTVRLTV